MSKKVGLLSALGIVGLAGAAHAFTAPAAGSFMYDIYDIAVEKLLKGPAGFVAGVGAMIFGAFSLLRGAVLQAVPAVLGGAVLVKADSIVSSLGMTF